MSRRFQYVSDLHLEKGFKYVRPKAPFLILAGDIAPLGTQVFNDFFSIHAPRFKNIFYVYGNHEFDSRKKQGILPANVIVLNNTELHLPLDNILIVGCTLWTPSTNHTANQTSVDFLSRTFNNPRYRYHKIVTVTHHLPSYKLITPKYKNYPRKDRFANNLEHLFVSQNPPHVWVCGHSHCVLDTQVAGTRCLINCDSSQELTFDL